MINLRGNFQDGDVNACNFIFLSQAEHELVRSWRNNENIRKWLYTEHIISSEEHQGFVKNLGYENRNYYWLIKRDEQYLGVICLNRVDLSNKNAYLGIYTDPDTSEKGLGTVLGKMLLYLAFNVLKLHTLKLEVLEENQRAINLYKKIGFKNEGKLEEFIIKGGCWKNVIIMGMVNNE